MFILLHYCISWLAASLLSVSYISIISNSQQHPHAKILISFTSKWYSSL